MIVLRQSTKASKFWDNSLSEAMRVLGREIMPVVIGRSVLVIAWVLSMSLASVAEEPASSPNRKALLVGCNSYPLEKSIRPLKGPANDVELLAGVLEGPLGFPREAIIRLTEFENRPDKRPTRENIVREFQTLAKNAKPGDQVVLLLAGHGFQAPNASSPDPNDLEPDGLDETFCPEDVRRNENGELTNMIFDDELRDWIGEITNEGAAVCLIVDACHSGTMIRAPEGEVARRIDAEELGLEKALEEARKRAREKPNAKRGAYDSSFDARTDMENVAAIYAAQSYEPEVELPFASPEDSKESKPYGLLAYTLCQVIGSNGSKRPLTYRELVERIRLQYTRMGREHPTPCVEGKNADKEWLGFKEWPGPVRFRLTETSAKTWELEAGQIHGLTKGSILAVYSEPDGETPVGYVSIESADVLSSQVKPCAFEGKPMAEDLPSPGFCEPAFLQFEDLRLKLLAETFAEPQSRTRSAVPETVVRSLEKMAGDKRGLYEIATRPAPNCWRVQVEGDQFYLVPPEGVSPDEPQESRRGFGPAPLGSLEPQLEKWLDQIARVELLKRMARPIAAETVRSFGSQTLDVEIQLIKYDSPKDRQGHIEPGGPEGIVLNEGEIVGFQVTNHSRRAEVYVTLLLINAGYGVKSLYPDKGEVAQRLPPGESFRTDAFRVNAKTVGKEHLVALTLKATGPPVDFTSLEQPTLELARNTRSVNGNDPLETPLGQLLQYSLYAKGNTRGLGRLEIDDHVIHLVTWTTRPKPKEDAP